MLFEKIVQSTGFVNRTLGLPARGAKNFAPRYDFEINKMLQAIEWFDRLFINIDCEKYL